MAYFYSDPCKTFDEFLLIPSLTKSNNIPENVDLSTPITKYKIGAQSKLKINIPIVSAVMQAVSGPDLAIALAKAGGISFLFGSQPIESQASMVKSVKSYKAGFVNSDSNLSPDNTLNDAINLIDKTGHSTIPITNDGQPNGKLMGLLTSRDYRIDKIDLSSKIKEYMTPFKALVYAYEGITLEVANDIIWKNKLNCLPVVDKSNNLCSLVFRKDYDSHKEHPYESIDQDKRLLVGAGINTRDYEKRIPALVNAGVDVLCIDSSDGFSEWQAKTIEFVRKEYGENVKIGAGNIVDEDGFNYLAEAGADFIKVGIGGGSICITREQKGIGRGQATSIIDVAKARDKYSKEKGIYIPICSDGGIVHDTHVLLALAMGADFVMLGRYFARFDESPSRRLRINGRYVKEYWGEGSNRARNWQRYDLGGAKNLKFEEGVDGYVPYAGKLQDNVDITITKIKSTMCNCGSLSIKEFQQNAKITPVSSISIREGSAHDIILKDNDNYNV